MNGTITVRNVGKAYKQYASRWSRLAEWLDPRHKPRHTLHWVLQDIDFAVDSGEAVGIIGINGAGKSTLLKLITGTSQPTTGTIHCPGQIAAMLELGMGFHPDFTGRQNAVMAGQLLGRSMEDIDRLMPSVEAFAEIGDYIDQPVRVYSSGMQVRLAFSVATAQRPDVLVIDEALSVGDAYFQHKSFDRIRQLNKEGTTLLLVSHDKMAIQSICDRAIMLNNGKIAKEGNPEEVFDFYNALLADNTGKNVQQIQITGDRAQTHSGTGEATLAGIQLANASGKPIKIVHVGEHVCLEIKILIHKDIPKLVVGFVIKDRCGQDVYGTNTAHLGSVKTDLHAGTVLKYQFNFDCNIGIGNYSVSVALANSSTHINKNYDWHDLALLFDVVNANLPFFCGEAYLFIDVNIKKDRGCST